MTQRSEANLRWREWRAQNATYYREWFRRYFKTYYEQNRERILKHQRHRFQNDPEFKARRDAARDAHKAKVRAGHKPAPTPIYRTIDGESERVFRSSEVARMIPCSPTALANWERQGWLPPAISERRRLYRQHQIELIRWFHSINCHDFDARIEASKFIFEKWSVS